MNKLLGLLKLNLNGGEKLKYPSNQYNLEFYFNIKPPFQFEINIIGI